MNKKVAFPLIVRCDRDFSDCLHDKLKLRVPIGWITQREFGRNGKWRKIPSFSSGCTTWKTKNGKGVGLGITLGRLITEDRAILCLEHEILHEIIGTLEDIKTGWEFDNCIYADYQRILMGVPPQVYNREYILAFFSQWS